jgi:membrane associated rhomboid family serine protease
MGIYNRDYYREWRAGGWGLDELTPVVKYLIFANIGVFLLQIFFLRNAPPVSPLDMVRKTNPELDELISKAEDGDAKAFKTLKKKYPGIEKMIKDEDDDGDSIPSFLPGTKVSVVQEWFELDTKKIVQRGQVWRLLTSAFCHDRYGLFHIFFNMLCLYWFGSTLETMYGSREFLLFYLTAAVVSGLAFVGLDLYTGSSVPAIGASGAVMAVMMLYTMHFPEQEIRVCWLFPLQMRWVMAFYLIFDLHPILLAMAGDRIFTGIGHAAHLGGLAFGFLYYRFSWRLDGLLSRLCWPSLKWTGRSRPQLRLLKPTDPAPERLDELLRKISESGQASLTEEERRILKTASDELRSRRGKDV